jgi:hypothetical protein
VPADKYIWSSLSNNECPPHSFRIIAEKDCVLAATAAKLAFTVKNVDLPSYPKGCFWASYGNVQQVWVNTNIGAGNPFSRLLCANDDSCDAGTFKPPNTAPDADKGCKDCEIGMYQPSPRQSSCLPCPQGKLGLKERAASEADGCKLCPAGTYQNASTPSGQCSVCAPGSTSNSPGMDRCDACLGPNAIAACPGGTAFVYTGRQLVAVADLLPVSLKTVIERQCQTNEAQLVRQAGALLSDDARSPSGLGSPTALTPITALVIVALLILILHGFIPKSVWSVLDITAQFHKVPQGGSPVKKNTQLGAAFTLALVFLVAALAVALIAANEVVATSALVRPKGKGYISKLRVSLSLPLGDAVGNGTAYCAGISFVQDSFKGMLCDKPSEPISGSFGKSCEFVLTGCTFTNPSAQLKFTLPWHERFLKWSVAMDSTYEGMESALSGVVTSGGASDLISVKQEVVVAVLAQKALLNDTTNAKLTRTGFELIQLPCRPPMVVPANGLHTTAPDLAWNLTIQVDASQNLYETVRFRRQDPLPLVMSIFSATVALMGIWKSTVFSHVEGLVSTLRELCSRQRRLRKERRESNDDGFELNRTQGTDATVLVEPSMLLETRLAAAHHDDVVASLAAALKTERKTRNEEIEDVLQSMQQQEKTIRQHEQTIHQHEKTIRELSQAVEQLYAIVSSLQAPEGRR